MNNIVSSSNHFSFDIKINNVCVNKHVIIHTTNCELVIKQGDRYLPFESGQFISIERGMVFSCYIIKKDPNKKPFNVIQMDRTLVLKLKNVISHLYPPFLEDIKERNIEHRIIGFKEHDELLLTYNAIQKIEDDDLKVLKIAYFISMVNRRADIIKSLYSSLVTTFTDKIKRMVEKEPEKQWRLNTIAEEFNITEISVRKRLVSENISFNQILLDVRMNKAMQLLLDNDIHINQISKKVGISTPSYFIRKFKEYFGVTPKQFLVYFRC
ncbi:helix-turn-helix transcriptional regulator [Escherichia marmotae]|uniref:AraC family transcriptional regulator n=1 Tax=Escherichia marmotae TaxID=1499973 RepID=UPI003CF8D268